MNSEDMEKIKRLHRKASEGLGVKKIYDDDYEINFDNGVNPQGSYNGDLLKIYMTIDPIGLPTRKFSTISYKELCESTDSDLVTKINEKIVEHLPEHKKGGRNDTSNFR